MKPHNTYEQTWQEAFADASMMPSEKVWSGIEQELNGGKTLNSWLTVWLVAASVSLTMALPLSLGESQLPADYLELQALNDRQILQPAEENSVLKDAMEAPATQQPLVAVLPVDRQSVVPVPSTPLDPEESIKDEFMALSAIESVSGFNQLGVYGKSELKLPSYLYGLVNTEFIVTPAKLRSDRYLSANLGGGQGQMGSGLNLNMASEYASPGFDLSDRLQSGNEQLYGDYEDPRRILTVGAAYEIGIGRRGALQLGLGYMNSSANGASFKLYQSATDLAPLAYKDKISEGLVYTSELYDYRVTDHYLSLPVLYKYAFLQRKFTIRGGAGVGVDALLSHGVSSTEFGKSGYGASEIGLNPMWFSLLANLEFGYWITPEYLLSVESGVRNGFGLGNAAQNQTNQSNYSFGLKFTYKLK